MIVQDMEGEEAPHPYMKEVLMNNAPSIKVLNSRAHSGMYPRPNSGDELGPVSLTDTIPGTLFKK